MNFALDGNEVDDDDDDVWGSGKITRFSLVKVSGLDVCHITMKIGS